MKGGYIILFIILLIVIVFIASQNMFNNISNIIPQQNYCGDGTCNSGENCASCSQDCGQCQQLNSQTINYTSQSYENKEPYYSAYCDKINPYDLSVREAAAEAIRADPGTYSVTQLFDIYDWIKTNIIYQNVALAGIPYPSSDTLTTKSGDCKNQAVLIASMIKSIGGTAKVVVDPSCHHAYAIVYFGLAGTDTSKFAQAVANHYGTNVQVNSVIINDGIWVIFDPAGGNYPGDTLPQCTGSRDVYYVTTCLSCVNQYPSKPYTYGDKCYSECPSGTIHSNNYACYPCPEGSNSYNNECFTCPSGTILGQDGKCHETCGDSKTYCITGTCFNGRCLTCQSGYSLRTDGKCWPD